MGVGKLKNIVEKGLGEDFPLRELGRLTKGLFARDVEENWQLMQKGDKGTLLCLMLESDGLVIKGVCLRVTSMACL